MKWLVVFYLLLASPCSSLTDSMMYPRNFVAQVVLASSATAALFPDCKSGPLANNTVCDPSADTLTRAQALVAVLTNEEKFNLTGNTSPGVPRLGLPSYQWWRKFDSEESSSDHS